MTKNDANLILARVRGNAKEHYNEIAKKLIENGYEESSVKATLKFYMADIDKRATSLTEDLDNFFCDMSAMEMALESLQTFVTEKEFIKAMELHSVKSFM